MQIEKKEKEETTPLCLYQEIPFFPTPLNFFPKYINLEINYD